MILKLIFVIFLTVAYSASSSTDSKLPNKTFLSLHDVILEQHFLIIEKIHEYNYSVNIFFENIENHPVKKMILNQYQLMAKNIKEYFHNENIEIFRKYYKLNYWKTNGNNISRIAREREVILNKKLQSSYEDLENEITVFNLQLKACESADKLKNIHLLLAIKIKEYLLALEMLQSDKTAYKKEKIYNQIFTNERQYKMKDLLVKQYNQIHEEIKAFKFN